MRSCRTRKQYFEEFREHFELVLPKHGVVDELQLSRPRNGCEELATLLHYLSPCKDPAMGAAKLIYLGCEGCGISLNWRRKSPKVLAACRVEPFAQWGI